MPLASTEPLARAYGAASARWAGPLGPQAPLVVSELDCVASAFAEAARRRKRGERFGASVLIDDPRARCALFIAAPPVLTQVSDYDRRAGLLDAVAFGALMLGGREQRDVERYDARLLRTAREFCLTADVVVTRSAVERERLCSLLGRHFRQTVALAPLDPTVPHPGPGRRERTAIVVWAPHLPAGACGLFAYALEEFRRPAIVVCGPGEPPAMRRGTRFVPATAGAEALAQAALILDASLTDPGTARALARYGVPLATASCSGAHDWLDALAVFEPWNHRSITAAVSNALGGNAAAERTTGDDGAELARALRRATPPLPPLPPLVSVIVPTCNRRATLSAALASIAGQTYPHLEIVLVNDGGPTFDAPPAAGTRPVRLIEFSVNRGVSAAVNAGIAAAQGAYIAILADDDLFCPDALAQLVEPLERTGSQIAHGIELGEHFECRPDGTLALVGHSLISGDTAAPVRLQTNNVIGGPAILFTRAAFERAGPFDERAGHLMDYEMWLRMSAADDFVHVDRVTAIMSMRDDTSQASAVSGVQTAGYYANIYALHPTLRPVIAAARETHLRDVAAIPVVRSLPQIRLSS